MKFRHLAFKNVRGHWRRYLAFFFSGAFSVMIFFIFASFIQHPDIRSANIRAANAVRQGMIACEYIIVIFSFFFVLYASFTFLKTRKKEFGLLTLFGMTRSQIQRLVLYENMAIGVLATVAGVGAGMLFSKLFFMALGRLLHLDSIIRFYVPPRALLYTLIGFPALFLSISLVAMMNVGGDQIVALVKAAKRPKKPPVSSVWLVLLSAVCLGAGYGLAYMTSLRTVMMTIFAGYLVGRPRHLLSIHAAQRRGIEAAAAEQRFVLQADEPDHHLADGVQDQRQCPNPVHGVRPECGDFDGGRNDIYLLSRHGEAGSAELPTDTRLSGERASCA
ncbi:ABC transporter permease [Paenibacillus sp. P26]|nr:ABC transporter permease [Paenibacillus sp. P26]